MVGPCNMKVYMRHMTEEEKVLSAIQDLEEVKRDCRQKLNAINQQRVEQETILIGINLKLDALKEKHKQILGAR